MVASKKPAGAKKKSSAKKTPATAGKSAVARQEHRIAVKLGIIVFAMLALSFLLIVLTKYQ